MLPILQKKSEILQSKTVEHHQFDNRNRHQCRGSHQLRSDFKTQKTLVCHRNQRTVYAQYHQAKRTHRHVARHAHRGHKTVGTRRFGKRIIQTNQRNRRVDKARKTIPEQHQSYVRLGKRQRQHWQFTRNFFHKSVQTFGNHSFGRASRFFNRWKIHV